MVDNRQESSLSFGSGDYWEGSQKYGGDVVLSGYKLYLKDGQHDLAKTFIPLEKVVRMKKKGSRIVFDVRPSLMERYTCGINLGRQAASLLIDEILDRRQLKKRLLRAEWVDISEHP